jgi:hypothetical protein
VGREEEGRECTDLERRGLVQVTNTTDCFWKGTREGKSGKGKREGNGGKGTLLYETCNKHRTDLKHICETFVGCMH